jgi:predicted nucleic acid-binding protein
MNDQQREAINRAEAARRIVEDPMVKEAFQIIEDGITEAWKDLPARDVEGREHLHRLLQAKKRFETVFQIVLEEGEVSKAELRAEEERKSILTRVKERLNA